MGSGPLLRPGGSGWGKEGLGREQVSRKEEARAEGKKERKENGEIGERGKRGDLEEGNIGKDERTVRDGERV